MADLPEWDSPEFYLHFWPNVRPRTHDSYRVYLSRLDPEGDVVGWINDSKSLGEKRIKLMLIRKLRDYVPNYEEMELWLNNVTKQSRKLLISGVNQTQQLDTERHEKYTAIQKTFFDYINFPIDGWTLFGKHLPPRRRDVVGLISVDERVPGTNCYERSTDTFVFYHYKSKTRRAALKKTDPDPDEIQEYKLGELLFLSGAQRAKVREYLMQNQTAVPDMSTNYFSDLYKRKNGGTINDHRHAWASLGRSQLGKMQYVALCHWMDHSVDTSITTYCI